MKSYKWIKVAVLTALTLGSSACKDFLDVNTNPNAPTQTQAINYLPPMVWWLMNSEQYDGRFVGRYAQEWTVPGVASASLGTWDRMGYDPSSDNAAQLYRDVYWNLGINLSNMINQSEAEQRWDLAGVGYVLRAWGWLKLTEMHGDIILTTAFTPDQYAFPFDSQDTVYKSVLGLLDKAIADLQRTDGIRDAAYIARGDGLFAGDATKWLKFAYGLKAIALNDYSNKTTYDPAAVIAAVDKSIQSPAEDMLFSFAHVDPTASNDCNFWGTSRQNLGSYRQTTFIAGLMDGTQYPGAVDPRISRMLAVDSTGSYHGLDISVGYVSSVTKDRPWNLWGFYGTGAQPALTPGRYLFDDRVRFPVMTYSQLQFIKAEAALKKGDQATARQAYLNGVSAHIDFVNARNLETTNPGITQISAAEKAAFLANPSIAPATITLSHIMGQKFIAQWGWAHLSSWMDERRYHYTDMDPASGTQVFRGFTLPLVFYPDNNNKPVQRVRPRYNSDYVWNRGELAKIGGLDLDYHTKPMWITTPGN